MSNHRQHVDFFCFWGQTISHFFLTFEVKPSAKNRLFDDRKRSSKNDANKTLNRSRGSYADGGVDSYLAPRKPPVDSVNSQNYPTRLMTPRGRRIVFGLKGFKHQKRFAIHPFGSVWRKHVVILKSWPQRIQWDMAWLPKYATHVPFPCVPWGP